ncbi:RNA 2',3'-cyclic phosphodiesterase [Streptacidiphilus sp. 4-A2]|nr:RNA 2',3'-cyclic phosphodiesterase [Streptacidiphilus sp. 4-A2]
MKLFAAIMPPQSAVQELAAAVRPLHALPQGASLRWTDLSGWHLTLAFLGQVDPEALPELGERLAGAAAEVPEFELGLGGGGRFGDRALWAGVHGDTAALGLLAAATVDAVRHAGLDVDERPFQAHLTLARSGIPRHATGRRRPPPGGPELAPLADTLAGFRGRPWRVSTLELMNSHPGAGPARYERQGSWQLGRN